MYERVISCRALGARCPAPESQGAHGDAPPATGNVQEFTRSYIARIIHGTSAPTATLRRRRRSSPLGRASRRVRARRRVVARSPERPRGGTGRTRCSICRIGRASRARVRPSAGPTECLRGPSGGRGAGGREEVAAAASSPGPAPTPRRSAPRTTPTEGAPAPWAPSPAGSRGRCGTAAPRPDGRGASATSRGGTPAPGRPSPPRAGAGGPPGRSAGRAPDGERRPFLARARGVPPRRRAHDRQVGVRQERERDVAVPGAPAAHLVLVHPHLALGLGEPFLDRPAHAGHAHQLL